MPSPKELHEYADECMDWARTARSDKEREIFLQMARTCLDAAAQQERTRLGCIPTFEDSMQVPCALSLGAEQRLLRVPG
jgi:hypothetical protein